MPQENVVFVNFDIFPAQVAAPERSWRDARVAVADGQVLVWVMNTGLPNTGSGPHLVYEATVVAQEGNVNKKRVLTLDTGQQVTILPQAGCGCGNPMRSWNPWPGQRKVYKPVGN